MDKNSEKEVRKGFYYDIMDSNHNVILTKMLIGTINLVIYSGLCLILL